MDNDQIKLRQIEVEEERRQAEAASKTAEGGSVTMSGKPSVEPAVTMSGKPDVAEGTTMSGKPTVAERRA